MVRKITILLLTSIGLILGGCSIKGSIEEFTDDVVENLSRHNPDFVNGEVVTSASGYQAVGVFGEISEKVESANSYQMEGAFYE